MGFYIGFSQLVSGGFAVCVGFSLVKWDFTLVLFSAVAPENRGLCCGGCFNFCLVAREFDLTFSFVICVYFQDLGDVNKVCI